MKIKISFILLLFTTPSIFTIGLGEGTVVETHNREAEEGHDKDPLEKDKQADAKHQAEIESGEGQNQSSTNSSSSSSGKEVEDPESGSTDSGGLNMSAETKHDPVDEKDDDDDSSSVDSDDSSSTISGADFIDTKTTLTSESVGDLQEKIDELKETINNKSWPERLKNWFLKLINQLGKDSDEAQLKQASKDMTKQQKQLELLEQAAKLPKDKLNDPDVQKIIEQYLKLPYQAYPESLADVLEKMNKGAQVRDAIKNKNFDQIESIKIVLEKLEPSDKEPSDKEPSDKELFIKLLTNDGSITDEQFARLRKSDHFAEMKKAYLRTIVDLQWDIYKQAMLDNSGFASGMVTIPDASENAMNFMENYVKLVNPDYKASGTSLSSIMNGEAYSRSGRMSSHWKGRVVDDRIYGIDVKFDGEYAKDLPGNKQQLHFGRLDNGTTFIKWEYSGTTLNSGDASLGRHALDYQKKQAMKKTGANKNEIFRKEHTLDATKDNFKEVMGDAYQDLSTEQLATIKEKGISGMLDVLQERVSSAPEGQEDTAAEALASFRESLKQQGYTAESLGIRKGNEVVLPPGLFEEAPTT